MKMLLTQNAIITLENVRKVEYKYYTTNHTSMGRKYSIIHHSIRITYLDDKFEIIDCGEDEEGLLKSKEIFTNIRNVLSKE